MYNIDIFFQIEHFWSCTFTIRSTLFYITYIQIELIFNHRNITNQQRKLSKTQSHSSLGKVKSTFVLIKKNKKTMYYIYIPLW